MLKRQASGSVVCPSCGKLVGVQDPECWNCGRRNPGMWGYAGAIRDLGRDLGFSSIVIGACVVLYVLELAIGGVHFGGLLSFLSPRTRLGFFLLGATGPVPVFEFGRWWTFLTAGWLHGGLLHIAINMYWVRQLGPSIAELYGPGRSVILYTASSVAGFAATTFVGQYFRFLPPILWGAPEFTLGASAAIFGWLGALVYYGHRTGSRELTRQVLMGFAVPVFIIGLLVPIMDNWAHMGGFAGGYVLARMLDPARPERIDHLLAALVCLALTLLALLLSVLHGLQFVNL